MKSKISDITSSISNAFKSVTEALGITHPKYENSKVGDFEFKPGTFQEHFESSTFLGRCDAKDIQAYVQQQTSMPEKQARAALETRLTNAQPGDNINMLKEKQKHYDFIDKDVAYMQHLLTLHRDYQDTPQHEDYDDKFDDLGH